MSVSPLGGKVSTGQSAEHSAQLAEFQEFKKDVLALIPINTEEKARKYREILIARKPEMKDTFRATGY